tara:strand:+ start:293 stop:634 length:342 start_codon:yes stop_codon:yes gene_type:complete
MYKIKLFISILLFGVFLIYTSFVKNQTRIIEKKIRKTNQQIAILKKDFHETQLDYSYLTSPKSLSRKINDLGQTEYSPMDFSRIYLNYSDFLEFDNKISTLNPTKNEKKIQKK